MPADSSLASQHAPGAELSIIVLHFRNAEQTVRAVRSIGSAHPAVSHEVIVVDNGSGDSSADFVGDACPEARVLRLQRNVGFAAGMNAGMREARGEFVLLLNSDIEVRHSSAIDDMIAFMRSTPDAGLCAPVLEDDGGRVTRTLLTQPTAARVLVPWVGRIAYDMWRARLGGDDGLASHPLDVEATEGAAVMVSRRALESAGMLDEDFFFYHEIVEWCMRLRDHGFRVSIVTQARMLHACGGSTGSVRKAARIELKRSEYQLLRKRLGRMWCTAVKFRDAIGEGLSVIFYFLLCVLTLGMYRRAKVKLLVHWGVFVWIAAGMPGRNSRAYIKWFGKWE